MRATRSRSRFFGGTEAALAWVVSGTLVLATGCPGDDDDATAESDDDPVLRVSGIPDQNVAHLNRQHELTQEYLSEATGLDVEYVPMTDYAALVTAFERGEIHLAWFGAFTGVQARDLVEDSRAIAHRARDAEFHSHFVANRDTDIEELADTEGHTFTFGSESSTSGHLMARHHLVEAGIDPEEDFASPANYSGSHDRTLELVSSGAYDAGAVNEAVWEDWVEDKDIEDDARLVDTTEPYYNYNWTAHGSVDEIFGEGTIDALQEALLALDQDDPDQAEIMEMYQGETFVETSNENYDAVMQTAKDVGLLE